MRQQIRIVLPILIFSGLAITATAQPRTDDLLDMTVTNSTGNYFVRVTKAELGETLTISLLASGRLTPIATYKSGGFIYARPEYSSDPDRLITLWQPGVALTAVIFRLAPSSQSGNVLFEQPSELEPDFINGDFTDLIGIYSGKHFVPGSDLWTPETVTIYGWNGRKYKQIQSAPYQRRFTAFAEAAEENFRSDKPK